MSLALMASVNLMNTVMVCRTHVLRDYNTQRQSTEEKLLVVVDNIFAMTLIQSLLIKIMT